MTNGFTGVTTFSFSNTVPLTSGVTYFLEPVIQTGDLWNLIASEYNYPGGSAYSSGFPATGSDYWFREGIITVPEPSSVCLGLAGAGALVWWRMAFSRFRGR
ncbi:MAG: PEP-CTERM sorting domain-containing protein [Verrucomicrobia bacterium]|nr:PEP-CTERM sorting domain-containing protein [Verrucomicrobiota bacterium]